MPELAPPIERLIAELTKLPGVGRKTAQRFAFHLLKAPSGEIGALASALTDLRDKTRLCARCFNWSEGETCLVCADARRDRTLVCVVEEPVNVASVERSGAFRGTYFVLGGALSPLRDIGPEDLRVQELLARLREDDVREVLLATSPTVEGEATAVYLARLVKPLEIRTTKLAQGLPAGADLEFTDDLTLKQAIEGRREY